MRAQNLPDKPTRRRFLAHAGRAVAVPFVAGFGSTARRELPASQPRASAPSSSPTSTTASTPRVRLVQAQSDRILCGNTVQIRLLRELLEKALVTLTDRKTPADAWRALLGEPRMLGLKFNRVGADRLGSTEPLALALIESLTHAGLQPDRIVLIEVPDTLIRRSRTRAPRFGWSGQPVDFGSGTDRLAAVLEQVSDLINIPFLKTHNIAGFTACLKNLSHAFVKHPARFHANGCSPFIGDIVALPQIRDKLRLHIVNALRIVLDGGPSVRNDCVVPAATLLLSTDGVAADAAALQILNRQRMTRNLPAVGDPTGAVPYLRAAADRGLGTLSPDRIDQRHVRM